MASARGEAIVCNLLVNQSSIKLWTDGLALCDKIDPYILPNHRKTMILSASTLLASACCFYSDLSVLCMVVVEEIVLRCRE